MVDAKSLTYCTWSSRLSVLKYLLMTSNCSHFFKKKKKSGIPVKMKPEFYIKYFRTNSIMSHIIVSVYMLNWENTYWPKYSLLTLWLKPSTVMCVYVLQQIPRCGTVRTSLAGPLWCTVCWLTAWTALRFCWRPEPPSTRPTTVSAPPCTLPHRRFRHVDCYTCQLVLMT